MNQDASGESAVANAYRDIDRYIAEVSGPRENIAEASQSCEGSPLSLSQRLQILGERHVGTLAPQEIAPQEIASQEIAPQEIASQEIAPPRETMPTPLPPNEF